MKKLLLLLFIIATFNAANAQTTQGPAEIKMTNALCDCISKLDMSKIITQEEANKAFTDCFTSHADLLTEVAAERNVEFSDNDGMKKIGTDIGVNLMKQKCAGFMQLAMKMSGKSETGSASAKQSSTGTFKRIENKGFNYIVVADAAGSQKSFLWLREFAGSEKFTGTAAALLNKRVKITWQEMEVYLPSAKGYYKVKEITAIDIL